ncbi:hypothetical protein DSO57_1030164 [Entomophthora muscae]|uniref:Uncharacterized protein n=1 Tax=Entomophthora muscae TaxID=34485 RepID=A0ACC2SDY2_9FUNG|nr:hypothetical protein DSO57_1030164 [Entomophthora muscae]
MTSKQMHAIVKSVLSGDTIILRGRPKNNAPPAERQISLNFISAPRLTSKKDSAQESQPFAFESREFLRRLLVGKEVGFTIHHSTPSGREYGSVVVEGKDVVELCVGEGWCTVREENRYSDEDAEMVEELKALQSKAKDEEKGIWSKDVQPANILSNFPEEPRAFLNKYKCIKLPAIIEQVRDASTFKVSLELPEAGTKTFQSALVYISGIKAPAVRKGVPGMEDLIEPYSEEAKFFVESRLLQKDIHVLLEGLSNNNLCGSIIFPAGNIAELLVANGMAKVVDWSITLVTGGPAKLRAAEKAAKEKKLRLWKNHTAKVVSAGNDASLDGVVTKIATGDIIHIQSKSTGVEKKVQFSSIRAPKLKDAKEGPYAHEAKEFLRKLLIGKSVKAKLDYVKPATEGFEERHCATVTFNSKDIGETLVSKGLAFVIRHRRDDDNRAANYDNLLVAEEEAKAANVGVHSDKEPPVYRFTDASENLAKAKQFLSFFQRTGKVNAVVEHIANASRFKLTVPSQNCKITFVLGGLRAPKVARTPQEVSEPFGEEAYNYVVSQAMQRDVTIEVEATDKTGGFIGTMWIDSKESLNCKLLENGFATVHEYSAAQSTQAAQLLAAERIAKSKNLRIWTTIKKEEAEDDAAALEKAKKAQAERVRVGISDMVDGSKFSIQIIGPELKELDRLMSELKIHHSSVSSASFSPKVGSLCSAQFSLDNQWYRAKVRKLNGTKSAEVVYLDFGNAETVPLSRLRPLPEKLSKLKPQAIEARFAYLRVPGIEEDYGPEAYDIIRDMIEGKEFEATIEARSQGIAHIVLFSDSKLSISKSINAKLVSAGYGVLLSSKRLPAALKFREQHLKALGEIQAQAKKSHLGMWEYGEVAGDDDDEL